MFKIVNFLTLNIIKSQIKGNGSFVSCPNKRRILRHSEKFNVTLRSQTKCHFYSKV